MLALLSPIISANVTVPFPLQSVLLDARLKTAKEGRNELTLQQTQEPFSTSADGALTSAISTAATRDLLTPVVAISGWDFVAVVVAIFGISVR